MGRGTRRFLFILGLVIFVIGAGLVFGGLISDGSANYDAETGAGLITAIVGVAFVLTGCMLCRQVEPTMAAVCGAIAVPFGLLTAACCAIAAIVLANIGSEFVDYDPKRASNMALIGAAVSLVLAIAGALNWWHWLRSQGSRESVRHLKQWLVIGWGSLTFCGGLVGAVVAVTGMAQHAGIGPDDLGDLAQTLAYAGSASLAIGAGALLVWHGAASLTGVPSGRLRIPPLWLPLLAAVAMVAAGGLLLRSDAAPGIVPLIHAIAILLPGLTILALVARGNRGLPAERRATWRDLCTMLAYGSAVAAFIAGIVNSVIIYGTITSVLAERGAFEHVSNWSDFSDQLRHASRYLSTADQLLLVLVVVAVIAPFNEEFWKGYGVRILRGTRLTRYQAFLFGAAAGVGFGMVEANQYGVGFFQADPHRWWEGMLLRGGSSSLHALASGIVGLGWYSFMRGNRARGLGLYLMAVGMHGSWNALNVIGASHTLPLIKNLSSESTERLTEAVAGVLALGILFMLWRLSASLADEDRDAPAAPIEPPPVSEHGYIPAGVAGATSG